MAQEIRSVLFVCLGNICRSPTAEAVFRHKAKQQGVFIESDSCGTHGYHIGSPPDERSVAAAKARGYNFDGIKCRKLSHQDFQQFDLIVAMDEVNLRNIQNECPAEQQDKIVLFMSFSDIAEDIVPDPYYGGKKGFDYVLDLIESASDGLLSQLSARSKPA